MALVIMKSGTSLVVQWLRLRTSTAGGCMFDPWLGNCDPTCREAWQKKKKETGYLFSEKDHEGSCLLFLPPTLGPITRYSYGLGIFLC